jgi:hypothetical protein
MLPSGEYVVLVNTSNATVLTLNLLGESIAVKQKRKVGTSF